MSNSIGGVIIEIMLCHCPCNYLPSGVTAILLEEQQKIEPWHIAHGEKKQLRMGQLCHIINPDWTVQGGIKKESGGTC